jgi:hypothetical protein
MGETKGPVVNELIDTTEMYLRTFYELEVVGVVLVLGRIAEHVQVDAELMVELKSAGIVPGQDIHVGVISRFGEAVPVNTGDGASTTVAPGVAHAVLVRAR